MQDTATMTMIKSTQKLLHVTLNLEKWQNQHASLSNQKHWAKYRVMCKSCNATIWEIHTVWTRDHKKGTNCSNSWSTTFESTWGSVNLTSGCDASPAKSCSMYSKTRYRLQDIRDVTRPSNLITFGWSSLRRMWISLAMKRTLSGSRLSNLTFFKATIFPWSRSRAR